MINPDEQEDYCELDNFEIRAKNVVRELIKMARMLSRRGYGTTQLVFSDSSGHSFVTLTCGGAINEVSALLGAGHAPLGFIAPDRDRKRNPFIELWERGDNAALAELRSVAHSTYWHLLPERNAQPRPSGK